MNHCNLHINPKTNLQHYVDVSYDEDVDCYSYGCNEEGICRCATIVNEHVKDICDFDGIAKSFLPKHASDIEKYCCGRLLRYALRPDYFSIYVDDGYYGEEIDSVNLDIESKYLQSLIDDYNSCSTLDERIKMILKLEYGYILPKLDQPMKWYIDKVKIKDISINKKTLEKIDTSIAKKYTIYTPDIHGIVFKNDNNGYSLIDGYHRWAAWTGFVVNSYAPKRKRKRNKIKMLIGEHA